MQRFYCYFTAFLLYYSIFFAFYPGCDKRDYVKLCIIALIATRIKCKESGNSRVKQGNSRNFLSIIIGSAILANSLVYYWIATKLFLAQELDTPVPKLFVSFRYLHAHIFRWFLNRRALKYPEYKQY